MIRPDGTADPAILSTITEAQRVPSIGTQLPAFAAEPLPPLSWAERYQPTRTPAKPERLTLWDQSADLWSE